MTFVELAAAIAKLGFTERQGRFLATVALHAGVCMAPHYCRFAGIRHGQKTHDFFADLVERRFATVYRCAPRSRESVPLPPTQSVRCDRRAGWPVPPADADRASDRAHDDSGRRSLKSGHHLVVGRRRKVTHFTRLLHERLDRDKLPHLTFGRGKAKATRYFLDKLPIGVRPETGTHVFTYLITRAVPVDFRQFLHRHAGLCEHFRAGRFGWSCRAI
jgi:hypothetical protein